MKRTQLARLRDGSLVRVQVEQREEPPIVYQQEYSRPARRSHQPIRHYDAPQRTGQHPISMFFLFLFVGFCACAIHPVCTFLLWGFGVLHLINGLLRRR